MIKLLLAVCCAISSLNHCAAQTTSDRQVSNLKTFAKLCGYIQYFYPGDEAAALNWQKFIYHGAREVEKAKNEAELFTILNGLFSPVAPAMMISLKNKKNKYIDIRPSNNSYHNIYWQHFGFKGHSIGSYFNQRTYRNDTGKYTFELEPAYNELFKDDISPGIELVMPLVLPGDSLHTYPLAPEISISALRNRIDKSWPAVVTGNDLYVRITGIILLWNALTHFNPHWVYADITPEKFIENGLRWCYANKTDVDFLGTLESLMEPFNDSHTGFLVDYFDSSYKAYTIPVRFEKTGNQIVVDYCRDSILGAYFKSGDIVELINGEPVIQRFEKIQKRFSGSPQFKQWISLTQLCVDTATQIRIKLAGKEPADFIKKMPESQFNTRQVKQKKTGWLNENVYYLDLDNTTDSVYYSSLPEIYKAKVLICDQRVYPKGDYSPNLIGKLLKQVADKRWLFFPKNIYPNQRQVSFHSSYWHIQPDSINPIKAKVYLLTSSRSISYAESVIGHFRHYQLATLIGQPTAGANGAITFLKLPGNYQVGWTQTLVKQQNGDQLFARGFAPDIYVERTLQGIREQRDEVLERALAEADKYLKRLK